MHRNIFFAVGMLENWETPNTAPAERRGDVRVRRRRCAPPP